MRQLLKLEWPGYDADQAMATFGQTPIRKPWVAELLRPHPKYILERSFLCGQIDFSEANSKGSRGVYLYFQLDEGKLYEYREHVSYSRSARVFCRVTPEGIRYQASKESMKECLESLSA